MRFVWRRIGHSGSLDDAISERGGAAWPVGRDEGLALVGGAAVGGCAQVGLHGLPHLRLELGLGSGSGLGLAQVGHHGPPHLLLRVELLLGLARHALDGDRRAVLPSSDFRALGCRSDCTGGGAYSQNLALSAASTRVGQRSVNFAARS